MCDSWCWLMAEKVGVRVGRKFVSRDIEQGDLPQMVWYRTGECQRTVGFGAEEGEVRGALNLPVFLRGVEGQLPKNTCWC